MQDHSPSASKIQLVATERRNLLNLATAMPRYYFSVYDGSDCPDRDGTELADVKAARQEGLRFVGALIAEEKMRIDLGEKWILEVSDAAGVTVMKLEVQN